jgi:hypothetical protein
MTCQFNPSLSNIYNVLYEIMFHNNKEIYNNMVAFKLLGISLFLSSFLTYGLLNDDVHEMLIDPFDEVLEEFKIQTDSISLGDLDDILEKLFERLHCVGHGMLPQQTCKNSLVSFFYT